MKIKNIPGRFMVIAAALIIASACASTRVTSDWKDQSYQKKPQKIMVLALLKNQSNARFMEDELVRQLKAAGTDAVPAYTVLPEGKPADKEAMAAKITETGADALFITKFVDKKTVRNYMPGTYYPPSAYFDWYGYYGGFYPRPGFYPGYPPGYIPPYPPYAAGGYPGGYTVEDVYDVAEANLYDAGTGKLVWSAITETAVDSDKSEIKSYVSEIVKTLQKKNLIR